MAFKTPNGTWRETVRMPDGSRPSGNFRTKAEAEAWGHSMRTRGSPPPPEPEPSPPPAPVPTVNELYESWKAARAGIELADSTIVYLDSRWKHVKASFGDMPVDQVSEEDCAGFRKHLVEVQQLKPAYANLIIETFRTLTALAHRRGLIEVDPWIEVKRIPVAEQAFGFWTPLERDRFLNVARRIDPEFAALATVALHTGLRWGELRALRRKHLDFDGGRILVVSNFRPAVARIVETTKTRTNGVVPMNDLVRRTLADRQLTAPEEPVFSARILEAAGRYRLPAVAKIAEVKPIRFHDLRHTFASCLAMAGVPLIEIQKLMRHKSIQTTMRYAHLCEAHLALAVNRLCDKNPESVTVLAPISASPAAGSRKGL